MRRLEAAVELAEPARDLAVGGEHVDVAREAEHRRVRRPDQRRRDDRDDRDLHHGSRPRPARSSAPRRAPGSRGRCVPSAVCGAVRRRHHRHRHQRDHRDAEVDQRHERRRRDDELAQVARAPPRCRARGSPPPRSRRRRRSRSRPRRSGRARLGLPNGSNGSRSVVSTSRSNEVIRPTTITASSSATPAIAITPSSRWRRAPVTPRDRQRRDQRDHERRR